MPSQSLPDGVEVWRIFKHTKPLYPNHAHVAVHGPDTDEIRVVRLSDLPKIEEQAIQKEREQLLSEKGMSAAVKALPPLFDAGGAPVYKVEIADAAIRAALAALEEDDDV